MLKYMNENNFERSEVVIRIITRKPGFAEKWALWLVLIVLIILFWGSSFIKYPVTIKTIGRIDSVFCLTDKFGKNYYAEVSIPGGNPHDIVKGQTVQLSYLKSDQNKVYVHSRIQSCLKLKNSKILKITINLTNGSITNKNKKTVIAEHSPVEVLIKSENYTVMQMFCNMVLKGIKL